METVTINQWPESQYCMDCDEGNFIERNNGQSSEYACNLCTYPGSQKCVYNDIPEDEATT